MIYSNDNLRIVPFERSKHLTENYRSWMINPETCKYNSHGLFPYTKAQMESFIKTIEEGDLSKIVWAIETRVDKNKLTPLQKICAYDWEHVGNVSLQSINYLNRSAELAIVIGEASARGKGIGKTACQFVLEHAFLSLGLNRVWTGTAAPNIAMQKTCESIRMNQEGVFKEGVFLQGEFVNVFAYGITADQYFN